MQGIKVGQVVKLPITGFYIVEPGSKFGELKLTPIVTDSSRETLVLTPELQSALIPYGKH